MKTLLLASLLTYLPFASAHAANPFEGKCSEATYAAQIQKQIMSDIRSRVTNGKVRGAFSFQFTSPFDNPHDKSYGLTAYFETTGGSMESRRGHVAQYTLDRESCAPSFQKVQMLVGGTDASAERLNNAKDHDACNFAEGQRKIIDGILTSAKWLAGQTNPGAELGNFSFTSVLRKDGSADVTAVYESTRKGMLSQAMLWQANVNPTTCEPEMRLATPFEGAPSER